MKQLVIHLRTGATELLEVAAPMVEPGHLLIRTQASLVSKGTEGMLLKFAQAGMLSKVRSQPERVRQILNKMRADGIRPTLETVFRKLDEPMPLGYSSSGFVTAVGAGVTGFAVGDRVASNGPHAEFVSVPANLAAKIPDGVDLESAAFTVLASIALQGIRLLKPEFGETVTVIGLGLIGQITVRLLRAAGVRVLATDVDAAKVAACRACSVDALTATPDTDAVGWAHQRTEGLGVDGVIITASTSSNEVIGQAAKMCRKRGHIILVGVVGLEIDRADFYEKELTFQVSCSYGPGRYDFHYEERGVDFPAAYVRWTENRNFRAVLEAMRAGTLSVSDLVTLREPLEGFSRVYASIGGDGLGSILTYTPDASYNPIASTSAKSPIETARAGSRALAVFGAGNFSRVTALPALRKSGAFVKTVVSAGGLSGAIAARQNDIPLSATDAQHVLDDPEIGGVIIATRHDLHASLTIAALRAGKHVLVEKPLCLSFAELQAIEEAAVSASAEGLTTTVGFNRRFAPHVLLMRELLGDASGGATIAMSINAGGLPLSHWANDEAVGGGRIVGELCHFVDLAICLAQSTVTQVTAVPLADETAGAVVTLRHANQAVTTAAYYANGSRALAKERIEVHQGGRSLVLDNFRVLTGYGFRRFRRSSTAQDKGHVEQFRRFAAMVREGGQPLIPWEQIVNATQATLLVPKALAERRTLHLPDACRDLQSQ